MITTRVPLCHFEKILITKSAADSYRFLGRDKSISEYFESKCKSFFYIYIFPFKNLYNNTKKHLKATIRITIT